MATEDLIGIFIVLGLCYIIYERFINDNNVLEGLNKNNGGNDNLFRGFK